MRENVRLKGQANKLEKMKRKSIDVLRAQIFKLKNKGLKARTITNRMNEFNGQNDQISFVV